MTKGADKKEMEGQTGPAADQKTGDNPAGFLRRLWRKRAVRILVWTFVFIFGYFGAVDLNLFWLFGKSPSMSDLKNPKTSQASEIYTADGILLGRYYAENRSPSKYSEITPILVKALVVTEDVRFYDHHGIDFKALASAIWASIKGDSRGASTITQQLAKNLFKTRTDVSKGLLSSLPGVGTIISKTKEWITAVKLENNFSKEDILTMYLNTVDFGANSFGIKTASKTYFSTIPDSLSLSQCAILVGLLKAPSYYSPLLHPKNSFARRNTVLSQMLKYNAIDAKTYNATRLEPVALNFHIDQPYDGPGTYFRGVMNNILKDWCKKHGKDLYSDGLKIYTTIDSRLQKLAEESVQEHMKTLQKRFEWHWLDKNPWVDEKNREIYGFIDSLVRHSDTYKRLIKKYPHDPYKIQHALNKRHRMKIFTWKGDRDTAISMIDSLAYYKRFLNAGFMSMDPYTAHITSWVGGIDYKYFKYDHVKQAKRQPGSTFKPFVYAAAFDKAGYGPCDRMVNRPITINYVEKGENKSWSPHNADYEFDMDSMTLRKALAVSVNAIAAQMTEKIGWNAVVEYAHRCGIQSNIAAVPSVCLGSSDVSLYELVGAYSTFLNKGVWQEPQFLIRITDKQGKVLEEFKPKTRRALTEENAFLMVHMLKGGLEEAGGTTANLWSYDLFKGSRENNELGGKTGTSSNHSDGWFVGVSKDLVAGAWVGGEERCIHFRTTEMGEGAKTALPIFGIFMEKVYADPSLGITKGRFPGPTIKITKNYNCTGWGRKKKKKGEDSTESAKGD